MTAGAEAISAAMEVVAARTDSWSTARLADAVTSPRPWLNGRSFADVVAAHGADELARQLDDYDAQVVDRDWRLGDGPPSDDGPVALARILRVDPLSAGDRRALLRAADAVEAARDEAAQDGDHGAAETRLLDRLARLLRERRGTTQPVRRCSVCTLDGHLDDQRVTQTDDSGDVVVVIRNVPAPVCDRCGTTTVTGDVAEQLERIAESHQGTSATGSVVVDFDQDAAAPFTEGTVDQLFDAADDVYAAEFARQDPIDGGTCRYCGAEDPIDRPMRHADSCTYARAVEASHHRWTAHEGWRIVVLERIDAVSAALRLGKAADRAAVEDALAALEAVTADPRRGGSTREET